LIFFDLGTFCRCENLDFYVPQNDVFFCVRVSMTISVQIIDWIVYVLQSITWMRFKSGTYRMPSRLATYNNLSHRPIYSWITCVNQRFYHIMIQCTFSFKSTLWFGADWLIYVKNSEHRKKYIWAKLRELSLIDVQQLL
jgi:hypothetical protein